MRQQLQAGPWKLGRPESCMPKEEKTQIEMEKKNKVAHARKKVPTLNMFNPTSKNHGFKPSIF